MKTSKHEVGDKIIVTMLKPKVGKFPISRHESGIICLLAKNSKDFYEYESSWEAEIVTVNEKSLIVRPIACVCTAAANKFEMESKSKELVKKYSK